MLEYSYIVFLRLAQDKALVNYVMQLYNNIGVPFRQNHIAAAAESILRDAMHMAGRD
jgi:hypothetical protein